MINGSACQLFHTHLIQIWIPIPVYLDTCVIWSLTPLPIWYAPAKKLHSKQNS